MSDDIDASQITDSVEKVNEVLTPKKFNLLDAIQNKAYPEDIVTVFTDEEAAYELQRVNAHLTELAQHKDRDESVLEQYTALEAEAEEYRQRILDSSLKIHMRAVPQPVYDRIIREVEDDKTIDERDKGQVVNERAVAATILKIVDGTGAVDDHEFTGDEVRALRGALGTREWNLITEALFGLTFGATYFDSAVDAGFLSRR